MKKKKEIAKSCTQKKGVGVGERGRCGGGGGGDGGVGGREEGSF
jgi:hypothetical protein